MSREVKRDHVSNPELFRQLLADAIGGESDAKFAKAAGISKFYLCRIRSASSGAMPAPKTILKIASVAHNGIRAEQLLDAAGYNPQKHMGNNSSLSGSQKEALCASVLRQALDASGKKYEMVAQPRPSVSYRAFDYQIIAKEAPSHSGRWFLEYISLPEPEDYQSVLSRLCAALLSGGLSRNDKISIILDSESLFDRLAHQSFDLLAVRFSLILLDLDTLSVVQELDMRTAITTEDGTDPFNILPTGQGR